MTDVSPAMGGIDRWEKLSCWQGPEYAQAGHGLAPRNPLINPHAHPPDESLGPLRRSDDCGVDEVSQDFNDFHDLEVSGFLARGTGPADLLLLFNFITDFLFPDHALF